MGQPVIHFEIIGKDGDKLQSYYSELFGWEIDANNPLRYGVVAREGNMNPGGVGIGGGVGPGPSPDYAGHVTFYVEVPDVEAALAKAETLGGMRLFGPDVVPGTDVELVDALIDGSPPPPEALKALAARERAIHALERGPDGELRSVSCPKRPSAAGKLLLDVVRQLGELEPSRLRRCARPECRLAFYDNTRPATQRWHAERPCGLRERQRRHRATHGV
jgi:uncharacterized protein